MTKYHIYAIILIIVFTLIPPMISITVVVIGAMYIAFSTTGMDKLQKKQYMRSAEWKSLRERVLHRDNYKCQVCNTTNSLEVHHITYKRIGSERLSDLATVCRNCHQAIHDKKGYKYTTTYNVH